MGQFIETLFAGVDGAANVVDIIRKHGINEVSMNKFNPIREWE